MRKKTVVIPLTALTAALAIGATLHMSEASDHEDKHGCPECDEKHFSEDENEDEDEHAHKGTA